MAKIKSCESCNQPFKGRSNAKTCSDRCRKRLQRTKKQLAREFKTELKQTAKKIEVLIDDAESLLEPAGSTEEGFIGDGAGAATSSPPTNKSTSAVGPPPASINSIPVSPPVQTAAPPGLFSGSLEYDNPQQQRPISQASTPSANLSASATAADAAEPLITQPTFSPPSQPRLADNPKRIRQFARPSRLAWALTAILVITLAGFSLFILNRSGQSSNTLKKPISSQASASTQNTLGDIESESLSFSIDTTVAKGKKFTATGPVAIQNEANSSHAFTIQTASGDNLLVADTKSKQIGINTVPSGNAALQVGGDIAASGNVTAAGVIAANGGATSLSNSGLRINNVLICTAAGCRNLAAQAASGQVFTGDAKTLSGHPASYFVSAANLTGVINDSHLSGNVALQNSNNTFTQINSFTAAGNTFVGDGSGLSAVDAAKLGGHDSTYYANASNLSSGTLNDSLLSNNVALLDADNNFTGANTFNGTTTQNGSYLFRSATNSLTAFQIQNAAGNDNLLVADTINTRVGIGLSPQYTLDVNGDINIAAGQSFRVGGTPICNSSGCAPSSGSNSYVQLQGNTPGSAQSGNLNVSGSAIAGSFYGNGLGLTSLNAS